MWLSPERYDFQVAYYVGSLCWDEDSDKNWVHGKSILNLLVTDVAAGDGHIDGCTFHRP